MPRPRGTDLPLRQSPRGTNQVRTSSSNSDPSHLRPVTDRSTKLVDRRSPRGGTQSETVNQKKLGTRIADLESQLGQAQQELKSLKNQLTSAEVEKKKAEEELVKKSISKNVQECKDKAETKPRESDIHDENEQETDVFEVPIEKLAIEFRKQEDQVEEETISEPEKVFVDELKLKNEEIVTLKSSLEEKKKEVETMSNENNDLKNQLNEANSKVRDYETKEEEMRMKMKELCEELEGSKKIEEKLKTVEEEKEGLEAEMKKLRVQTEQWRKAADAAAAVLEGGFGNNGIGRVPERCGSMDKHFGGGTTFETPNGVGRYHGYVDFPGMVDDLDDGGKKKGSGIRMFGDLWKKKGQK